MQSSSTLPPGWRIPTLDGARSRGIYVQFYDPYGHRYGIPTYPYHWAPKHLYTTRQLRAKGLRPGGQVLPGAEDADEGGVHDADGESGESGGLVGQVSATSARCRD
jgi:hypothetical protein